LLPNADPYAIETLDLLAEIANFDGPQQTLISSRWRQLRQRQTLRKEGPQSREAKASKCSPCPSGYRREDSRVPSQSALRARTSLRRSATIGGALLLVILLSAGCAARHPWLLTSQHHAAALSSGAAKRIARADVLEPFLAERIQHLAMRSPSFQDAWDMIRASGVAVRVGTRAQLHAQLPRWYREHPGEWGGVTIISSNARAEISSAVVVLPLDQIEDRARTLPPGTSYLTDEVDRVLIHEIYGHLAPAIEASSARAECPDQLEPGEVTSCVQRREWKIAAELASYGR
jgi:hypothetical protein